MCTFCAGDARIDGHETAYTYMCVYVYVSVSVCQRMREREREREREMRSREWQREHLMEGLLVLLYMI